MTTSLAGLYSVLIGLTVVFQVALILGAPWGHLTQGGAHEGPLPRGARVGAGLSNVLLVVMGCAILSSAGHWPAWPVWSGWLALGVTGLGMILNLITPSRAERLLWGPVTVMMFLSALGVMLL